MMHTARLLFLGVLGGAIVFWFWLYEAGAPDTLSVLLESVSVGIGYTFLMALAQSSSGHLLGKRVPLHSTRAVLIHVSVQATVTLASFLGATVLLALALQWNMSFLWSQGLISIGIVAFLISLIGNGLGYLSAFYKQLREAEKATLEAELRALRAQINPHFLFNSLNSIAALIRTRPTEAEAVTEDLADLFRYSLKASQQPSVTLGEELESVRIYLAIEQARFRERLHAAIDVPHELHGLDVPSLLLQPLIENAIKHGVGRMTETCMVRLQAQCINDAVELTVTDTGPGFDVLDPGIIMTRGTGLQNINQRLQHFFGPQAALHIAANGVTLCFPMRSTLLQPDTPLPAPDVRFSPSPQA